jgi:hypothetical protein
VALSSWHLSFVLRAACWPTSMTMCFCARVISGHACSSPDPFHNRPLPPPFRPCYMYGQPN